MRSLRRLYPVFVEYAEDGRVSSVTVQFISDDEDEFEDDSEDENELWSDDEDEE